MIMEKIARFRLKSYVIDNASIKFDKNNVPKDMKVDIGRGGNRANDNEYHFFINVRVIDKNGDNMFELNVNCSSVFEFDRELTEEEVRRYTSINAPAILFPYVRAYISTLTSLSGISPVVLPTINLSASEQKTEE